MKVYITFPEVIEFSKEGEKEVEELKSARDALVEVKNGLVEVLYDIDSAASSLGTLFPKIREEVQGLLERTKKLIDDLKTETGEK